MSGPAATSPPSEDEDLRRLHRRLDEVLGPGHAATLMTCLRPGGRRTVTAEAWGGMCDRLREVLGDASAEYMISCLHRVPWYDDSTPD